MDFNKIRKLFASKRILVLVLVLCLLIGGTTFTVVLVNSFLNSDEEPPKTIVVTRPKTSSSSSSGSTQPQDNTSEPQSSTPTSDGNGNSKPQTSQPSATTKPNTNTEVPMTNDRLAAILKKVDNLKKTHQTELRFTSPDTAMNNFLNEYMQRTFRYNELSDCTYFGFGNSYTLTKDWETKSFAWTDARTSMGNDYMALTKKWLENVPIDKYGFVWGNNLLVEMGNVVPNALHFEAWPFPNYFQSKGTSIGYEFSSNAESNLNNWRINDSVPSNYTSQSINEGYWKIGFDGNSDQSLILDTPTFTGQKIKAENAPNLQLDIGIYDNNLSGISNIDDLYIWWQTAAEPTWTEDKCVSSQFASMPFSDGFSIFNQRALQFKMYTHAKWTGRITKVRFEIRPKAGKNLDIAVSLNNLKFDFDARHADNIFQYISTATSYYKYTGDNEFLENNLPRLRSAMQFYLSTMGGENGIVSRSYFKGQDSYGNTLGRGIGAGYWDCLSWPVKDQSTNMNFYGALKDMQYLEACAEDNELNAIKPSVVVGQTNNNDVVSQYNYTSQTLKTLLDEARAKIDAYFWNPETGRYMQGLYDQDNSKMDFGVTDFNMQMILLGIPDENKSKSIMDWITGKRIVEGDESQGEDIYHWEFGPRANTRSNAGQWVWNADGVTMQLGDQVLNGGSIIYMSYFDMMARDKVYGASSAYERLQGMQKWYEKVKAAGGEGPNFFRAYYDNLGESMQGGGTAGAIGIDSEFIEAAIVCSYPSYGILGIDVDANGRLIAKPSLPSNLDYFRIENIMFRGLKYDMTVGQNFLDINSVRGNTPNQKVFVMLDVPKKAGYGVYVDGVKQDSSDYTIQNGKICIEVEFKNTRVVVA